jgi:hypothetical protein
LGKEENQEEEAEVDAEPGVDAEPEVDAEPGVDAEAEVDAEARVDAEAEVDAEARVDAEADKLLILFYSIISSPLFFNPRTEQEKKEQREQIRRFLNIENLKLN